MQSTIDGLEFRRILGHYPTGVCAITATNEEGPIAMIVGSFTSVSLDPPLVSFLPDRRSTSWLKIQSTGRFCVNVLSHQQEKVCRTLSSKVENKFETVAYRRSTAGLPILNGVIAWIECDLVAVHEAGDHYIAIGQVRALDVEQYQPPLLFFRGCYGSFSPIKSEIPQPVS